ncbi:MAG: DUF4157 domain-containing protein [Moorea sp. SIO3C2]|nr:DUF4157 domain-containing protein [Moorena sp. SIO3C2]
MEKMTRQYDLGRSNKSPQKDTDNWILQRSAVRTLPAKRLTPQIESPASVRSDLKLDLMQIPVSDRSAMPVQAKLEIRPAGDKYEQEADQVAKQVVQQLHGSQSGKLQQRQTLQRQGNREVDEELQRKPRLQLKGDREGMTTTPELESSIARSRGSGQPLSEGIREPMEKAFGGVDFSGVRVHTDGDSDQLNQSMQAKAFTTGQDVFFRQGAYDPGSQGGQELLAHELTHVVQQNAGTVQRQIVQCNGDDDRKKKKDRLDPSKFRSQYTRDAIEDRDKAREQGITVDELRSQEQEKRLSGFRASLTGLYPEEFDQVREQLNTIGAGLKQDCDKMLQILEEEKKLHQIITQIATIPVETRDKSPEDIAGEQLGGHIRELNRNASFYREQEHKSNKKKGFKKLYESGESKTKRKTEKASNAQKAEEYEKQRQFIVDNKSRLANIIPLHNVRKNKDVGDIKLPKITNMAEYVNEQIKTAETAKTAGSEFDISHLNEVAGYLEQEPKMRILLARIFKEGVQSLYTNRQKIKETIEKLEKGIKELQPGKFESFLGKMGVSETREKELLIAQGQQELNKAIEELDYLKSLIELVEAPRNKERVERNERMYQGWLSRQ